MVRAWPDHSVLSHCKGASHEYPQFLMIGVAAASMALAGCATSPGYGGGYSNPGYGSSTASCYDCGTVTRIELVRTGHRGPGRRGSGRHRRRGRRSRDLAHTGGSKGNQNVAAAAGAVGGAVAGNATQKMQATCTTSMYAWTTAAWSRAAKRPRRHPRRLVRTRLQRSGDAALTPARPDDQPRLGASPPPAAQHRLKTKRPRNADQRSVRNRRRGRQVRKNKKRNPAWAGFQNPVTTTGSR